MSVKKVQILATKHTPEISLNPEGIIKIKGRSMKGSVTEFYEQIQKRTTFFELEDLV